MPQLLAPPRFQPISPAGTTYPGAKAIFYITGTTTLTDTYTSSALTTANSNPVIADSAGLFPVIYLNPVINYRMYLTTSADVLIYDVDPVAGSAGATSAIDADTLNGQAGSYYLNATNLNAGTVPDARFPATLPAVSGVNLTALNASNLTSGTIPDARIQSTGVTQHQANFGALAAASVTVNGATVPANGMYLSAANTVAFASNTTLRLSVNSTGNWVIAAPSSGSTVAGTGISAGVVFSATISGNGVGLSATNGTSTGVACYFSGNEIYFGSTSAHSARLLSNNISRVEVASTGAVTVNAPTSGTALTVTGAALTPTSSQSFTATPTFNAALANVFEFSGAMTANVTAVTISNATAGQTISIRVKQDGTGSRTFATPSGAKIFGAVGATASAASILTLTYSAMDSRWEGAWVTLPV